MLRPTNARTIQQARALVILVSLGALASCAGGGSLGLLLVLLVAVAGCGQFDTEPVGGTPDMGNGTWEMCCLDDAGPGLCFCPEGMACNYGWTCLDAGSPEVGFDLGVSDTSVSDTGVSDRGLGTWDPCCVDGILDVCYCPEGRACNYGAYTDCGDGTCAEGRLECTP